MHDVHLCQSDHRSSYAKCRLFCWGLLSVVETLSSVAKVPFVSHLATFPLFVFVIRYLFQITGRD